MKRLIALALAGVAAVSAQAQAPQAPEIAARSYVLLDMTTNKVLAEREADVPNDPASLTKLMTAYLTFQALKEKRLTLDQELSVSKRAWE